MCVEMLSLTSSTSTDAPMRITASLSRSFGLALPKALMLRATSTPFTVKEHGVIGSIEGTQNVRPDEVFVSGLDRRASLDLADNGRRTPEHVRPLIGIDTELIADHVSVSIQAQGALNNDHSAVRIGREGSDPAVDEPRLPPSSSHSRGAVRPDRLPRPHWRRTGRCSPAARRGRSHHPGSRPGSAPPCT